MTTVGSGEYTYELSGELGKAALRVKNSAW